MKILPGTTTSQKTSFQKILVCYSGQNRILIKIQWQPCTSRFFHSYLNYGNIVWANTTKSKLRKIESQERQAVNAMPKNDNQGITNSRTFMEENGILNVYKLNFYQVLNFMFRVHNETIPKSFQTKLQYIEHKYETRQSKDNFILPKRNTRITRFAISSRGPRIWNSLTNNPTKTIDFYPLLKSTIKENLLKLKTETNYF